jgi:hypothetical protein
MLTKASGNTDQWCFSEAEKLKIKIFCFDFLRFFPQRIFRSSNERKNCLLLEARFTLIFRLGGDR